MEHYSGTRISYSTYYILMYGAQQSTANHYDGVSLYGVCTPYYIYLLFQTEGMFSRSIALYYVPI